ncbi:Eco57I restriction-modification methylase domain-containing protein [Peribacillus simplex]|uniref:Eco57I restriction-modification methylase domain-containing protein n=1 Tax=Peribacillus simplex TaxID=1478 RepID=UPI0024C0D1BC|nr:TaqI-like C-terminal specificity domain-containing protein [Peribacillus simplex]WHY95410.1 TaqI-like C-terminal specificity domain-containing protein [Peribacillus simplex]
MNFDIPNEIFSNISTKGREADGIIDIFDRFNFTINEAEPLEKDVAVDPEMLGKIFENLLDVKDRKSKGAFYTPREIVHYMCQESLINYLVNEINVPYNDIKEFILYGELIKDADNRKDVGYSVNFTIKKSILDNIVNIDNALKNVKIADPAVGSGAFPLGMLSEIVKARSNITEYIIRKDKEGAFGRIFGEQYWRKRRSHYKLKRETIKNSIFAVDIEPSAIDIAKLRLWLSVVVEQEIDDQTPEPYPLPNLEWNIMVGDSLVDEYEGLKLFDASILNKKKKTRKKKNDKDTTIQFELLLDNTEEMLNEMFQLQDRYFDEEDESRKSDIKQRIDLLREDLIEYKLQVDGNEEGLKKYKELVRNKQKPYFLWYLEFAKIFQVESGFDIVIGNPPYLEISNSAINDYYKKNYNQVLSGHYDLYLFFFKKAVDLCNDKGTIAYITPHTFLHYPQYINLRKWLYENSNIIEITSRISGIFESAVVDNTITILSKQIDIDIKTKFSEKEFNKKGLDNKELTEIQKNNYDYETFDINAIKNKSIIEKYSVNTEKLGEIVDLCQGITVYAKAQGEKINWFRNGKENEYSRPVTRGAEIFRYQLKWSGQYIEYGDWLWRKRKYKFFEKEKIFLRQTSDKIIATYVEEEMCCIDSVHSLIPKNHLYELKYILAILNSKLGNYFYKLLIMETGKVYAQVKLSFLKQIPIKNVNKKTQDQLIYLVDNALTENDENKLKLIIREIDVLVYRIYELNNNDINKIEQEIN